MMPSPVEKLKKILELETEKYQDKAVVGGLARYADTWQQEARRAFGVDRQDWVQSIAERLRNYVHIPSTEARRKAIAVLLEMLQQPKSDASHERKPKPSPKPKRKPRKPARRKSSTAHKRTGLDSPVTALHGVGPRQSKRLARLGIHTIRDMLYFFPRRYDDYSHLKTINRLEYGEEVTVIGQVKRANVHRTRGGGSLFKALLSDGTGTIEVTWFNQPYLANSITPGQQIVVSGTVDEYLGRLCFTSPEWELLENELLHTGRLVPVYPLTEGLRAKWMRRLMKRTADYWSKRMPDHLPVSVRERNDLLSLESAIVQIHFPEDEQMLRQARYRLAFDELFIVQVGLLMKRAAWRSEPGQPLPIEEETLSAYVGSLPFELTGAQERVLHQIVSDLRAASPMNRLLQGDVGSGKTAVAALAMALTVKAGRQAALMAPTEILAEQHHQTLQRFFEALPGHSPTLRLLTGSVTGEERQEIYAGLADGTIDVVVGTHALIQEAVEFERLTLVVIDEQHRFGVEQRTTLKQKGYNPHLLVMTATPIPRSLALTVWGHMDVSVIDEMPPGRKPIQTRMLLPTARERAYNFLRKQVEKGRQAFIICPLVEESDKIEAKAATEEYERLQKHIFPDLKMGLLHGRMKGEEKEAVMGRFARGERDILVATSVVEVGIDVPNATVMLIEGANRFGLAQLHQLRGRVGRGEHTSYCLLVSDSSSPTAQERLQAVEATNDGFVLAEKDLEMRGPGEFLGTRQSGFPELKLARVTDLRLVEKARDAAQRLFAADPKLSDPDHRLLARRVADLWNAEGEPA